MVFFPARHTTTAVTQPQAPRNEAAKICPEINGIII